MTKQALNYYKDHPRIRGEHRVASIRGWRRGGSSPHTRGARPAVRCYSPASRIIPAYAGSTQDPTEPSQENMDHPRIRGEHGAGLSNRRRSEGSSPHTRGARSPYRQVRR